MFNITPEENRRDCELEALDAQIAAIREALDNTALALEKVNEAAEACGCALSDPEAGMVLKRPYERALGFAHAQLARILAHGRNIAVPFSLSQKTGDSVADLRNWSAVRIAEEFFAANGTPEEAERHQAFARIGDTLRQAKVEVGGPLVILEIPCFFLSTGNGTVELGSSEPAQANFETVCDLFRLVLAESTNVRFEDCRAPVPQPWEIVRGHRPVPSGDLFRKETIHGRNSARFMARRRVQFRLEPSVWSRVQAALEPLTRRS